MLRDTPDVDFLADAPGNADLFVGRAIVRQTQDQASVVLRIWKGVKSIRERG